MLLLIWNTQDSSSVLIYLPQNATGTHSLQTQSTELFLTLTFICSTLRERARSRYFPHLVMNNSMEFKDHQWHYVRDSREIQPKSQLVPSVCSASNKGPKTLQSTWASRETVWRSQPLEPERPELDFCLWYWLATGINYLAFPRFRFLIYKVGMITSPWSQVKMEGNNSMKFMVPGL